MRLPSASSSSSSSLLHPPHLSQNPHLCFSSFYAIIRLFIARSAISRTLRVLVEHIFYEPFSFRDIVAPTPEANFRRSFRSHFVSDVACTIHNKGCVTERTRRAGRWARKLHKNGLRSNSMNRGFFRKEPRTSKGFRQLSSKGTLPKGDYQPRQTILSHYRSKSANLALQEQFETVQIRRCQNCALRNRTLRKVHGRLFRGLCLASYPFVLIRRFPFQ